MSHTQQVVYDLESGVLGGEVDCGDGADLGELGSCVVCRVGSVVSRGSRGMQSTSLTFEEREDGYHASRGDVDNQLILPDRELLDVLGQAAHEPRAIAVQGVGLGGVLVGGVDDRDVELLGVVPGRQPHVLDILGYGDIMARGRGEALHGLFAPELKGGSGFHGS